MLLDSKSDRNHEVLKQFFNGGNMDFDSSYQKFREISISSEVGRWYNIVKQSSWTKRSDLWRELD